MPTLPLLALLAVLATPDPAAGPGWREVARKGGVTVAARARKDARVPELRAVGLIDAPPHAVWRALRDYAAYPRVMPYTQEARVVRNEAQGRVLYVYSLVNAPLVSKRDYVVRTEDVSDWRAGKGYLALRWRAANDVVPERKDVVRVRLNDGYWRFEPRDAGRRTYATYYLFTDPGGAIPAWMVDKANHSTLPDVFRALEKAARP